MRHVHTVAPARTYHNNLKVRGTIPWLPGDPHERSGGENKVKLPEMSERSVDPVREDTVKSAVMGVGLIEVPPSCGLAI